MIRVNVTRLDDDTVSVTVDGHAGPDNVPATTPEDARERLQVCAAISGLTGALIYDKRGMQGADETGHAWCQLSIRRDILGLASRDAAHLSMYLNGIRAIVENYPGHVFLMVTKEVGLG